MNGDFRTTLAMHLVLLSAMIALAAIQTGPAKPVTAGEVGGVEVSAEVLASNRFCEYGPKAYMVYFPIEVTITNARHTPIIVAKGLNVQRILLGASVSDLTAGKYELATPVRPLRSSGLNVKFDTPAPSDDFAVLKHNQSYAFTTVQGIPVRNLTADAAPGTVPDGNHFISVEVQSWPYARDAGATKTQWSRYGELISEPLVSFPSPIQLPANPVVEKCGLIIH
ncbi:MAG TPA: hypothetical protein VN176_15465 [Verrucomicrobiae bacterium]|jgi:hypothetical protein|nr:hypothetical protein [Verrucomicrobiae bacterium]